MEMKVTGKICRMIGRWLAMMAVVIMAVACSDDLYESINGGQDDVDGIGFSLSVTEQSEQIYNYGGGGSSSRAAAVDSAVIAANTFSAHAFEGNSMGLQVHRMPLPMVGIHPHTVSSGNTGGETSSMRAPLSEVVEKDDPLSFHDSLTIWGYTSTAYKTVNNETTTEIFRQNILKKVRGWRSSAHWPYGGENMKFYAVAPAMEALDITVGNTPGYTTAPTLKFVVPDNPDEQRDLLYGKSEVISNVDTRVKTLGEDDKIVPLSFSHILTAVRFAQGNIPTNVTIKSVGLYHIKNEGTYTPGTGWAVSDKTGGSYTVETNWTSESYSPGSNVYIKDKNNKDFVLFLLPHTLTSVAEIHVTLLEHTYKTDANGNLKDPREFTGETKEHTVKATLTGDVWSPGYTVTYKITIGELEEGYYFIATDPAELEHSSSSQESSFNVQSFRNFIDYAEEAEGKIPADKYAKAVDWSIVGYSLTEKTADEAFDPLSVRSVSDIPWLSFKDLNIETATTGGNVNAEFTVASQAVAKTVNHQTNLGGTAAEYRDLMTYDPNGKTQNYSDSGGNTANCYIVNRAGSYTIPLIYGNQKKGEAPFVDHTGQPIAHVWIYDQLVSVGEGKGGAAHTTETEPTETQTSQVVDDSYSDKIITTTTYQCQKDKSEYVWESEGLRAKVLWQDVNGLITNVIPELSKKNHTESGNGCLEFAVKSNPVPGNAVIALQMRRKHTWLTGTKTVVETKDKETNEVITTVTTGPTYSIDDEKYDGYENVWAWHIWVTDEIYSTNYDDTQYPTYDSEKHTRLVDLNNFSSTTRVMPVNLGWVPDENEVGYYEPRYVWVKLQQATTGNTAVVRIVQHARQPLITGTSTIYQWGRPFPLPVVLKNDCTTKRTIYDGDGNDITDNFVITAFSGDIKESILHPDQMGRYSSSDWWNTSTDYDLWSGSGELADKTVYDPCPAGFCIPKKDVFYGFKLDGATDYSAISNGNLLNMWKNEGSQTNGKVKQGGYLYAAAHKELTATDRYGMMIYLPSGGTWSNNIGAGTKLDDVGTGCRLDNPSSVILWTADKPSKKGNAIFLRPKWDEASEEVLNFSKSYNYGTAMPIRPKTSNTTTCE